MLEKRTTTVDLLRHGEPVGGRKYRGQTDDALSETGWAQMRAAVDGHRPWDVIVSSTLLRCIEFARELAARHAGIICLIVSEVLELPLSRLYRLHVPHAGLTRIRVEYHGERLMPQLLFHAGSL